MIKVKVMGQDWKVYLHTPEKFERKTDSSDAAFVLPELREAHFNSGDLTREVVCHEVWHMWRAGLLTNSARLDTDQEEEMSAELFACHADKMLRFARALYKELKALDDEG